MRRPTTDMVGEGQPEISGKTLGQVRCQLEEDPTLTAQQLKEQNCMLLQGVHVRSSQKDLLKKIKYRKL